MPIYRSDIVRSGAVTLCTGESKVAGNIMSTRPQNRLIIESIRPPRSEAENCLDGPRRRTDALANEGRPTVQGTEPGNLQRARRVVSKDRNSGGYSAQGQWAFVVPATSDI